MHPLLMRQKNLINQFFEKVDPSMMQIAADQLMRCQGNILFTGVGKSGLAAEQLAMMMTSIGTKAFYLSPMNALHGDLGMISNPDLVIFLSKSGNTEELYQLAILLKERKIPTMGWFCQNNGKLVKLCDTVIYLPLEKELCPYDLSPTTSTIIQLIFGNTLAVDLMEKKNFSLEKYYLNHPSGNIGKKISLKVQDVMIKSPMIPVCSLQQPIQEILVELSDKRCGCILVFDEDKKLQGIFTDGDLRRAIKQDQEKVFTNPVQRYMTRSFLSIAPTATLQDAIATMQNKIDQKQVGALPVMQEETLLGLIRLHDIVGLGLN